jgi:hypothetical protein
MDARYQRRRRLSIEASRRHTGGALPASHRRRRNQAAGLSLSFKASEIRHGRAARTRKR